MKGHWNFNRATFQSFCPWNVTDVKYWQPDWKFATWKYFSLQCYIFLTANSVIASWSPSEYCFFQKKAIEITRQYIMDSFHKLYIVWIILLLLEIVSLNIFTQSSSKRQIFHHEFQEGVWKIRCVTTLLLEIASR